MGQRFKAAREKKRIMLSQAALKTRIKIQHLEMMERDDFSRMPAPMYARGFIKMYAEFLGLDPAPHLQDYNERHGGSAKRPPLPVDVPLARPAPGDEPLPTAAEAAGPAAGTAAPARVLDGFFTLLGGLVRPQALAAAGVVAGVILLVVVAIKFWPGRGPDDRRNEAHGIVQVDRPVRRSPLAVMREPPEPYLATGAEGKRAP